MPPILRASPSGSARSAPGHWQLSVGSTLFDLSLASRRGRRLKQGATRGSVVQQSGIPTGRADAFPVELVEPEAPVPVVPDMVEPTVVSGAFSDDDTPAEVGFFSRMMLLLTSQHCLGVTP